MKRKLLVQGMQDLLHIPCIQTNTKAIETGLVYPHPQESIPYTTLHREMVEIKHTGKPNLCKPS